MESQQGELNTSFDEMSNQLRPLHSGKEEQQGGFLESSKELVAGHSMVTATLMGQHSLKPRKRAVECLGLADYVSNPPFKIRYTQAESNRVGDLYHKSTYAGFYCAHKEKGKEIELPASLARVSLFHSRFMRPTTGWVRPQLRSLKLI